MKTRIISNLDSLAEELASNEQEKQYWKDFLVSLAEGYGKETLSEKLREPIVELIQNVGEDSLIEGVYVLNEKLEDFPLAQILKVALRIAGEIRKEKEKYIEELREILSELEIPVINIWPDILLVPLVGTIDSNRAQNMAEKLLDRTASTRTKVVIIDVTGVPMIDTVVGGFLIETISAVKLLGSDVILTGIKPEIAHTLVKIGVDFEMVTIKSDLENALRYAIKVISEDNTIKKKNRKKASSKKPKAF